MTETVSHPMHFAGLSPGFGALVESLRQRRVAVIGHARPDGDCIGSQVALARVLRKLGAEPACVNRDPVPRRLAFLCADEPFLRPGDFRPEGHIPLAVDCADADRPGPEVRALFDGYEAGIDHHLSNTRFARRNFVDSGAAATAEILAGMFLDNRWPIDRVTAQALYVGLATDTGQFRFPSTSPRVLEIAARLLELGADPAAAADELYERESLGKMKLLQAFLASLRLECGGRVCLGVLPPNVFAEAGAAPEDTEGLVDYARCIEGVEIAALIEDRGSETKGSLRAKDERFRVNDLAGRFEGGGHACAAGFTVGLPFRDFYPGFVEALGKHLREVEAAGGELRNGTG